MMSSQGGQTVLIDGYNVIKRHEPWRRLLLQEARTRLVALVSRSGWPGPVVRVVLVFDGPEAGPGAAHGTGPVQVRFASPSADADIQHAIRTSAHPDRLLVITDDGEILRTARSHGARCHSGRWLLARALAQPPRSEPAVGRTDLPAGAARRITEELAKRWLKNDSAD